jgi:hypothetical protein
LNVFDVNFSFKFDVDLYFQNANLIKNLFYDVAYSNDCLHVKFSRISRQMNEFIFDRRENNFVTTRLRFAVSVHFFQNATIVFDAICTLICWYRSRNSTLRFDEKIASIISKNQRCKTNTIWEKWKNSAIYRRWCYSLSSCRCL